MHWPASSGSEMIVVMGHHLHLLHHRLVLHGIPRSSSSPNASTKFLVQRRRCSYTGRKRGGIIRKHRGVFLPSSSYSSSSSQGVSQQLNEQDTSSSTGHCGGSPGNNSISKERDLQTLPHVQTLRKYPKEELQGKVVMVRFDSTVLLFRDSCSPSASNAIHTIKYLLQAGAKVILVSDWRKNANSKLADATSVADILSSALQRKVVAIEFIPSDKQMKMGLLEKGDVLLLPNLSLHKEEVANCLKFSQQLSSGVDIFVNDTFFVSHKMLASTIGIPRFCSASIAGFHFEENLCQLQKVLETTMKPFVAIIGGANLVEKEGALRFFVSRCDGLIFVGMMSFQIMHALGHRVPSQLLESGTHQAALSVIQLAREKNIPILYLKDFWCTNDHLPMQMKMVPATDILDGWLPVDIGPGSLDEINSLLTKCKKVIWIGPVKLKFSSQLTHGESKLAEILYESSQRNCHVTVVGNKASKAIMRESSSTLAYDTIENSSVIWEFFKGRKLPGIMALDRAYPFEIDWSAVYHDPKRPLVVDIGSGNGLFILGMARRRNDFNFLGLEINRKLVQHCLDSVRQGGIQNGFFISTNATSTFRSLVSSYPGGLVLVSIQCPNPDFNNPDHRWRMLQRSLVEAVVDILAPGGKVFLQSDIEAVAVRMKEQFLKYGKDKLITPNSHQNAKANQGEWLKDNPFGVRSDWEQHVIDRGAPMYRLMLSKSTTVK